ncbi:MAG: MarP family serine protease [Propionibacteriaceae bacterium]|nr:MarP family serine protease [Propionibacteriaceae bacterium]
MTGALVLDVVLIIVLALQAVAGWKRGFVASVLGVIGLIAGGWIALWGIPTVLAPSPTSASALTRSVVMLFGVALLAILGYGLMSDLGRRIMAERREGALGRGDSFIGAVVSAVMAAVLLGLAALALYPLAPASWRGLMDDSVVVGALSDHTPPSVVEFAARATGELYDAGFPRVFGDPGAEPDLPADSPDGSIADNEAVRQAAASVVKVNSAMPTCNSAGTGSGWVVAPERVVTNAHVVAGSERVTIQVRGLGMRQRAEVVAFDPQLDLAVLAVPGLRAAPLERAGAALAAGDSAVVAGFPRGGPYRTEAARVRGRLAATGTDIYDRQAVQREVYSVYARVVPGNSGGPLLTADGRVAGTVFARSATSPDTGFVITDDGADEILDNARSVSSPVGTGTCAA